jgi:transketolase
MESLEQTDNILSIEPIDQKLQAFNFDVVRFNGHDFKEIKEAFEVNKNSSNDKPKAYVADTIKAYGISFTQGVSKWHYRSPSEEELRKGLKELDLVINA